ncbi:transposase [uncultured Rhodoblastus sp.]|uniref:IS66-like element accessory protein TnpA n=1 Tax=uncultured Rhodoblastus sp. TaxID=543037 RepID=UPI0025EE596E|nr:transposase [uncultured Rhodoblastus sp.]
MRNDSPNDTHQDNRNDNGGYRRIELITGTTRRRRWSDDERARILAESFEAGANISAVARRHGVHGGLLHSWRKKARMRADEAAQTDPPLFIPVAVAKANGDVLQNRARRTAANRNQKSACGCGVPLAVHRVRRPPNIEYPNVANH